MADPQAPSETPEDEKPQGPLLTVPLWRKDPYRIFFPLGWLLALVGVGQWLLLPLGLTQEYRSIFHSMTQVQGFLTCYALGFLLTFVPRRTATEPPSAGLMVLLLICPVVTSAFAYFELWAISQLSWMVLLVTMIGFILARAFSKAGARRVPPSFVWIPISLVLALVATVVTGGAAYLGEQWMWLHDVARGAILQGLFTGLVLGVGGLFLPMVTHAEPPPQLTDAQRRVQQAAHALGALAYVGSFWAEGVGLLSTAYAIRAFVAFAVLGLGARQFRLPKEKGLIRWLAWIAAWCLPAGFAVVAVLPGYKQIGLHVVFIGCFALLTFCVSTHVVLSHAGQYMPLRQSPWQLWAMALLLAIALGLRAMVALDQERFYLWVGLATVPFLLALGAWLQLNAPWLLPQSRITMGHADG